MHVFKFPYTSVPFNVLVLNKYFFFSNWPVVGLLRDINKKNPVSGLLYYCTTCTCNSNNNTVTLVIVDTEIKGQRYLQNDLIYVIYTLLYK